MTEQTEKWNAQERKNHPIFTGVLRYFPDALLEVAELSKIGNDQHNPGEPLHWARGKSNDQGDALVRHQLDAGSRDADGVRHSAKVAWRALAQLQLEIEADADQTEKQAEVLVAAPAQDDITTRRWRYRVGQGTEFDGWYPDDLRRPGDVWTSSASDFNWVWNGFDWV